MDRINEMMDQLSELSDDQVVELQQTIISEFETVEKEDPTPQSVDAMTSLADMLDAVRTETKQRETQAAELAQRASEAAGRVYGQEGDDMEDTSSDSLEEMPGGDKPDESEAAEMPVDKDEKGVDTPVVPMGGGDMEEAPAVEPMTPTDDSQPMQMEEEEDEEERRKAMTEASITEDEATELSTKSEQVTETLTTTEVVEEASVNEEAAAELSSDEESTYSVDDSGKDANVDTSENAEAATIVVNEPEAQEKLEAPVTAAADNAENLDIEVPADRRPTSRGNYAPVAITAGADIPGYTAGSPLENMSTVAEAMAKRIHALRRVNGGDGEQHIVASITTSFPEERTLTTDSESNWSKIKNVVSPEALVAAGGHQAPFESRYDIFGVGTTARPVRDALPRFQADRGGIRFITPPILSAYGDAVGVWTAANDAAESPDPATKASLTVVAASEVSVATDAVTLQMQFGNLATRAYPELIARHNELGLIQHARTAEQYLLSEIADYSTAVTTNSLIGFGRDFLVQVGRAAVGYRSRHRLEADAPLRVIIPSWVRDAMAADLALAMPGDGLLNAYGEIDGYVASRGVVVSYSLDQNVYGPQTTGELNEFFDSFTWYLFAEGTFLFLDGGTLDLGIIRDSSLLGSNDYKMFVETFEGVAMVGIEALAVTSAISVNGVAAALRDTTGGATAAAIEY